MYHEDKIDIAYAGGMGGLVILIILILIAALTIRSCIPAPAEAAEVVDLTIIAQIESSNNPLAYNSKSGATGLYQITPICLKDYNQYHSVQYNMTDMYDADKCFIVADWYLSDRIPQMLRYYGHTVDLNNILIAYNWGISHIGEPLPKETRDYIKRYKAIKMRK